MTLPELAALAAKHVPDFKRPMCACFECDEGTVVDQFGGDAKACRSCNGAGFKPDNCPAALLMAVMEFAYRTGSEVRTDYSAFGIQVQTKSGYPQWLTGVWDFDPKLANQEAIARAALVALLRAHGVEVSDER